MKNTTLLALFIVSVFSLFYTPDSYSQLSSKERLKYPLALDIPGKVYSNPGPVNTMPNPLEFFNINISQNSAPQNEPSVRISRKDTNRVVAAWRDFRYGSDPTANRRVGYSYSSNGGADMVGIKAAGFNIAAGRINKEQRPRGYNRYCR